MNFYEKAVALSNKLSLNKKARLMEYLGAVLRRDLEVEAFRRLPWYEFIDHTEGILADDPIKRLLQLPLEDR